MRQFIKSSLSVIAAATISMTVAGSTLAAEKSLYDRLGGKPALQAVVGELWNNVAADKRINARFANTKPDAFGGQLVDFLCEASGGPCKYKGKDMVAAHKGMKLSDADFNALAEDTVKALDKFKVPAKEKGEVMGLLGGLKGAVTNK